MFPDHILKLVGWPEARLGGGSTVLATVLSPISRTLYLVDVVILSQLLHRVYPETVRTLQVCAGRRDDLGGVSRSPAGTDGHAPCADIVRHFVSAKPHVASGQGGTMRSGNEKKN